ncbi:TonB-dependent receptor domain-containing protein [Porphyromonas pogonae]|uniref:TonB-dependent receptor domain-containing protein n=1 Tax=Porphyromonas pogonae TaxID=867595 RepID=UPI002E79BD3A|nr:TonB-dependent receptor [Porphyromonas pogonae]
MKKNLLLIITLAMALPLLAKADGNPVDSVKVYNLQDVTVYSTRSALPLKRVPGKIEVIPSRTIANSSYSNLADILKNNSSVGVIQYSGYNTVIGIRGFKPSGKYVTVLVNGVPAGTDNISTLGVTDIEQVEILKGPFSSIYGTNAMGGVLNLITKKNKGDLTGNVSLSVGSFQASRGALNLGGALVDKLSFDLNVSFDNQAQGYKTGKHNLLSLSPLEEVILDTATKGIRMMGSNFGAATGRLRLGYEFSPLWSLDVYQTIFSGADIPTGGSIWGVYGNKKKDIGRSATSLELRGGIGNHKLLFTPYYNIERNKNYTLYADTAYVNYKSKYQTYGATLQDNFKIADQDFVLGLDSRNMQTKSDRYKARNEKEKPYQPGYRTNSMGIFAQMNFKLLNDKLLISTGARADFMKFKLEANDLLKNEAKTESYNIVSPNVGVKYELLRGLMLHGSWGRSFAAPDAYQKSGQYDGPFGRTEGNPDLKPEKSRTTDFGVGYSNFDKGIQVDITYFDTRHSDMIISYKKDKTITSYLNAQKAKMRGLELMASYNLGSLWANSFVLKPYINATLMLDTKVKIDANKDEWSQMLYTRRQNISFGIEYRGEEGIEFVLNGRFTGHRYEENWYKYYPKVRPTLNAMLEKENPELAAKGLLRMPQFLIFDTSLYYHVNSHLMVGANMNNIFNENYTEKDGYNMPGRNVMFKATYQF